MGCICSSSVDSLTSSSGIPGQTDRHPCYSQEAHHRYARMHLPVAPRCNIGCNYCNRKYDCVNESRPGVTSEILSPEAARDKYKLVKAKIPNLSVVGIAGPGDALANWEETRRTMELIRAEDSNIIFCLSTNGLMLPAYAPEIVRLGVNHVTVTLNCLDPDAGAKIYKFVTYQGKKYEGREGAEILVRNQLDGIRCLISQGVMVKMNIVMIHGINEAEIPQVAKKAKELGAFITNIMPLIPAPGSAFEQFPQTSMRQLNEMRDICQLDIRQMRHCRQCRADAIGMLDQDISHQFRTATQELRVSPVKAVKKQYRIAVTSKYGKLVDQHFGHAEEFLIYETDGKSLVLVEKRQVEKYCLGVTDCDENTRKATVVETVGDCHAVLTMRIGYHAQKRLLQKNIMSVEYCYTVESGVFYAAQQLSRKEAM